jgi:hypothetical protein
MKSADAPDLRRESEAERDDRNLAAALITVFVACVFGIVWFAFPLARRR